MDTLFTARTYEWIFRIILAAALGCLIGYERYSRSKEAGVRTHSIVCLAAAMMMILSKYGFDDVANYDAARVAAQIIPGIGFLGAGIIFVRNDSIQGLTTAAGIFATSGIGMCIGAGLYTTGIFAALLIILIQTILHHTNYFSASHTSMSLNIVMLPKGSTKTIVELLDKEGFTVSDMHVSGESADSGEWRLNLEIFTAKDLEPQKIIDVLSHAENVSSVTIAH